MRNNPFHSYLGLAMRAGKLTTGDTGVMEAIRKGDAKLVVLAQDASDNAKKKYKDKCSHYGVTLMEYGSREELGASIGKAERVVLAVTDPGFAKMIGKCQVKPAEVERIDETRQQ
jgi:ribosomal protein L7Ae-like RNA K-turn-binding protein